LLDCSTTSGIAQAVLPAGLLSPLQALHRPDNSQRRPTIAAQMFMTVDELPLFIALAATPLYSKPQTADSAHLSCLISNNNT